jgi:tRNA nucleotidyltransferase (CCA-adding enzyme)
MLIKYPQSLHLIFEKLLTHGIKPVIVGGYVRDSIINIPSHDIDIELYNVHSFEQVENILQTFGSPNSVGKSFGICKLHYKDLELDFSLPRRDSKKGAGHQGFAIEVDTKLDFTTAASRRDFTVNAIGFDVDTKQILDPFHGMEDLKKGYLKAVDLKKFDEDPLRILRTVMFHSRFDLKVENSLFRKCKEMMQKGVLHELPRERIYEEIKKTLLKSKKPSQGFFLLKQLNGFLFFHEFNSLKNEEYMKILQSLDIFAQELFDDENKNMAVFLALLSGKFTSSMRDSFFNKLTKSKKIITLTNKLIQTQYNLDSLDNYAVYKLATAIEIEIYARYLHAFYLGKEKKKIEKLLTKAEKLNVLHKKKEPFITGKVLLKHNFSASKEFAKILDDAYEAQMREEFTNKDTADIWLKDYLSRL